jgi:hypothetical protein
MVRRDRLPSSSGSTLPLKDDHQQAAVAVHTHGIARQKIQAVPHWHDSQLFAPLERLVMEYAETITATPPTVDDQLARRLRVHLDEAQLVELTMIACPENARLRLNSAVGLTSQGFNGCCALPRSKGTPERSIDKTPHGSRAKNVSRGW